jgi:hypothetical protein
LRSDRLFGTLDQRLFPGFAQLGRGMKGKIIPERHFAVLHFLCDVFGVLLGVVPLGEIQMTAALVHIARNEP